MAQITGQLGTSESLLGQLELGTYDSEISKEARNDLTLTSTASATRQQVQSVTGWVLFPAKLGSRQSLSLI